MVDHSSNCLIHHKNQLADEIHSVLRVRELHRSNYKGCSPHLCFRRLLVDWLAVITEKLHLSHGILHLAVALFDTLLDKYSDFQGYSSLQLCALCCLWIAAKLDERDDLIPKISTLQIFLSKENYFHEDFLQMELNIMQILDWRLSIPTPVQFLDYYLEDIVSKDDYHAGYLITSYERAQLYVKKYALYFLGVVLQDHIFNIYLPSQVTAALLAASRKCLTITPTWPKAMVEKSGYSYNMLEECVQKLLKHHEADQIRCNQSKLA